MLTILIEYRPWAKHNVNSIIYVVVTTRFYLILNFSPRTYIFTQTRFSPNCHHGSSGKLFSWGLRVPPKTVLEARAIVIYIYIAFIARRLIDVSHTPLLYMYTTYYMITHIILTW